MLGYELLLITIKLCDWVFKWDKSRDKQIIRCCWAFILDRVFNELRQDY